MAGKSVCNQNGARARRSRLRCPLPHERSDMKKRILIIDDEEHIRRMMRLTLEAAGYQVEEASNGNDGVRLYGDGSSWSMVVLDQRMPGMDGLETLRELKRQNAEARVVM